MPGGRVSSPIATDIYKCKYLHLATYLSMHPWFQKPLIRYIHVVAVMDVNVLAAQLIHTTMQHRTMFVPPGLP
jgi:hypothetical protein